MTYTVLPESRLSPAQREVMGWTAVGKTEPEIAAITNRTRRTVKAHKVESLRRLDACNSTYAISKLWEKGWIKRTAAICLMLQAFALATDLHQVRASARPARELQRIGRTQRTNARLRKEELADLTLQIALGDRA